MMKAPIALTLFLVLTVFASTAHAQESSQWSAPKFQIYGGYDFLRIDVTTQSNGVYSHPVYNLNGGGGQLIFNTNQRLALVGEVSGYALISGHIQPALLSYLAGPRLTLRRGRIVPFVHSLFGGAFSKDGINNTGYGSVFGMAAGGGVDWNLNRHIAIRPLQAEYFLMKFPDGANNRQNGFRYSTGVVFRLG